VEKVILFLMMINLCICTDGLPWRGHFLRGTAMHRLVVINLQFGCYVYTFMLLLILSDMNRAFAYVGNLFVWSDVSKL